ncbi:FkbM family methyltransferase [Spiribacter sp. 221]|uniref:FkbM family methyltransferase n=1 Tax=Spiribacter onubensis TaxID=3122420 RepID=UPI00349FA274
MKLNAYQLSVMAAASVKKNLTITIIGANDGRINDPLFPLISGPLKNRCTAVLIEPNESLNSILRENYSFTKRKVIINSAVSNQSNITLYSVKEAFWAHCQPTYAQNWPNYRAPTGITSVDRNFVKKWIEKYQSASFNSDAAIDSRTVRCSRLQPLLSEKASMESIDVLQIDAEGHDDHVLYASDIELLLPGIIFIEITHLSRERLNALRKHLVECAYSCVLQGENMMAIRVPQDTTDP